MPENLPDMDWVCCKVAYKRFTGWFNKIGTMDSDFSELSESDCLLHVCPRLSDLTAVAKRNIENTFSTPSYIELSLQLNNSCSGWWGSPSRESRINDWGAIRGHAEACHLCSYAVIFLLICKLIFQVWRRISLNMNSMFNKMSAYWLIMMFDSNDKNWFPPLNSPHQVTSITCFDWAQTGESSTKPGHPIILFFIQDDRLHTSAFKEADVGPQIIEVTDNRGIDNVISVP